MKNEGVIDFIVKGPKRCIWLVTFPKRLERVTVPPRRLVKSSIRQHTDALSPDLSPDNLPRLVETLEVSKANDTPLFLPGEAIYCSRKSLARLNPQQGLATLG